MASSSYGRKLNPYRRLRDPLGVKGVRQSVVVTNNPSSIDQNQQLLVRFPNLGAHDVVVPGTARLAFTVSLTSTNANRTIVKNVGRAVVKKTTIKISGNEVLSIDDSDVLHCYQDLWKTAQERRNSQYQGIDLSDDSNVTRIRVGAGNKDETETEDAAIAAAYGNRYHIPLDFELLESHMPFYQSALGDRLEYELKVSEWQRLHQFQSRLHRRLSRKTPKKSPQGGQVQLPEKPNKKASWKSSVLPNNPCKQRLLLRRQRP